MKKKPIIWLTVALIIVAALGASPYLFNLNTYKPRLEELASHYAGRNVAIRGNIHLSYLHGIALSLKDVHVANSPNFSHKEMFSAEEVKVHVGLVPLLYRQLEVKEISLIKPVIALEENSKGEVNWALPKGVETAESSAEATESSTLPFLAGGKLHIKDGTVYYQTKQKEQLFSDVHLDLAIDKDNSNVTGKIAFVQDKKPFSLKATLKSLAQLQKGEVANLAVEMEQKDGKASLQGNIQNTGKIWQLTDAIIGYEALSFKGDLTLNLAGKVPSIKGKLATDKLDITPYQPKEVATKEANKLPVTSQNIWSTKPLNIPPLTFCNALISLNIGEIRTRTLTLGASLAELSLENGNLLLKLQEMAFYGGKLTGQLVLRTTEKPTSASLDGYVRRVNIAKLLKDLKLEATLHGEGETEFHLITQGNTEKALIENLSGRGGIRVENGAIKGIDFRALAPTVTSLISVFKPGEKDTLFDVLSGTYIVKNGIVDNRDLLMSGSMITVAGQGIIDLPRYVLAYKILPKETSLMKGNLSDIAISLDGPLNNPKMRIDLRRMLEEVPAKLPAMVRDIKDGTRQLPQEIEKGLKGLLKSF